MGDQPDQPDLAALAAALDAYEPPPAEWTDELWELYRSTEVPEPHPPLTQEQEHLFARERDRDAGCPQWRVCWNP